jgi:hypothetical protein
MYRNKLQENVGSNEVFAPTCEFSKQKNHLFYKKIKFHKLNFKLIQQKKYEGVNLSFEISYSQ